MTEKIYQFQSHNGNLLPTRVNRFFLLKILKDLSSHNIHKNPKIEISIVGSSLRPCWAYKTGFNIIIIHIYYPLEAVYNTIRNITITK